MPLIAPLHAATLMLFASAHRVSMTGAGASARAAWPFCSIFLASLPLPLRPASSPSSYRFGGKFDLAVIDLNLNNLV